MADFLDRLFNRHKFVRRAGMFWAWWIITVVLLRTTEPDTITQITPAGATIVTATIGILATVIGLYNRSRSAEDGETDVQGPIPLGSLDDHKRDRGVSHDHTDRFPDHPGLD